MTPPGDAPMAALEEVLEVIEEPATACITYLVMQSAFLVSAGAGPSPRLDTG